MLSQIALSHDELIEALQAYLQRKKGPRIEVTVEDVSPGSATVTCKEEEVPDDEWGSHY